MLTRVPANRLTPLIAGYLEDRNIQAEVKGRVISGGGFNLEVERLGGLDLTHVRVRGVLAESGGLACAMKKWGRSKQLSTVFG